MTYLCQVIIDFAILALLAGSMNLLLAGGLFLVSQAASFGLGAYVAALCSLKLNCDFVLSSALGASASGLASLVMSIPAKSLRGDSFIMMSLAVQIFIYTILLNAVHLTGGPYGLSNIPKPVVAGLVIQSRPALVMLYSAIVCVCMAIIYLLARSGFGRSLTAIREDELAAKSLGIPVARRKTQALFFAAIFAGIAGSLFAHQAGYLDPTSFTLDASILIVSVCAIGGMGSVAGAISGALALTAIQEALRFVDFPTSTTGALRLLIYGLLLVWIVLKTPRGLAGSFALN